MQFQQTHFKIQFHHTHFNINFVTPLKQSLWKKNKHYSKRRSNKSHLQKFCFVSVCVGVHRTLRCLISSWSISLFWSRKWWKITITKPKVLHIGLRRNSGRPYQDCIFGSVGQIWDSCRCKSACRGLGRRSCWMNLNCFGLGGGRIFGFVILFEVTVLKSEKFELK